MASASKIAISLPGDLIREVETRRRKTGESRTDFIRRAIELALASGDRDRIDAAYEAGYRRWPEGADEIAESEAVSQFLAEEPWDEDCPGI
jgi:Arc/MetJ-type ribon-helix-helix transcriptional regulator